MQTPVAVYEPFKAGLPPIKSYLRSLWRRRQFISEYSRSELGEQHYDSLFGQLWLIINPLLLSGVYFLLIVIIGGSSDSTRYAHLTSSLFLFYLVANSLTGGVKSITTGQRLILNTAFPRIMLPLSAAIIALFKFLPTLIVFLIIRAIVGLSWSFAMFWAIPIFLITFLLGLGLAILISCVNVYFRDISNFLPYLTRTMLYLSPILYEAKSMSEKLKVIELVNPLFPILDSWSKVMVYAQSPSLSQLATGFGWALGIFIVGTYIFLSRERDFAVRL